MKRGMCMLAAAMVLAVAATAQADVVTYDQNLGSPGFYNGSGNPDGGFVVSTNTGIVLGLRARVRQDPNVIHSSNGIYNVPAGVQPSSPTNEAWVFDFSIDLRSGNLTLGDLDSTRTTLTITDLTQGGSPVVVPVLAIPDDSTYGLVKHTSGVAANPSDWGVQNSEQLRWFPTPNFSMYAPDTYQFTLDVYQVNGSLLASDTMLVNVVPLPAAAWGGMILLGGLAATKGLKRLGRRQA